ncbi:hypothetical protein ACH4GE_40800 [Streptomyces tendae]|uniref:hypothetical protein n=1 Tax=Streptomyces tendae TaxID=1932 RepID=UPI0037AD0B4B
MQTYRTHQRACSRRWPSTALHDMFGLIGHALDINLRDHADIVEDVQILYEKAGAPWRSELQAAGVAVT